MEGILLMMTRTPSIVLIVHTISMDGGRRGYRDTIDTAFVGRTRRKLDIAINYTLEAILSNEASISISVFYVTLVTF